MATQVTTASSKTVSFKSPYTGSTFQKLVEELLGQDGYLSGGLTSDNGATITVEAFKFVSRGIIGESLASSALDVPTSSENWYIVASLPDDDPDSGIVVWVTTSRAAAANGVVIATKTGDVWRNPDGVDIKAALERPTEPGPESGFTGTYRNTGDVYDSADGTTVVDLIMANRGLAVHPLGGRRVTDPIAGESARHLESSPVPASIIGNRSDRIVLRQREAFSSEVAYLVGGMSNEINQTITALGTGDGHSHWHGESSGALADQWMVWGDGSDLHNYGPFGNLTLLTGGATIGEVKILGQRDSDGALIVVYIDGSDLRMVSFHPTTGAIVNASIALEALGSVVLRFDATLDQEEKVRVVFEYDDGTSPSQQIYYGKFNTATASFGVAERTPRYLELANSGFNDTKPEIQICRNGISHIVFIRGVGTDEFGSMRYVRLDQNDNVLDGRTYSAATEVGTPDSQVEVGIGPEAYDDFELLSLTVTPHDEVFAAVGVRPVGQTSPQGLLLFSPDLEDRTGYPFVTIPQSSGAVERDSIGITHGDGGELYVSSMLTTDKILTTHISPKPGISGVADFIVGESSGGEDSVANTSIGMLTVGFGPTGELIYVYDKGANGITRDRRSAIANVVPSLHPNDVLLQTVSIEQSAVGAVTEGSVEVLQSRQKGTKLPVVIGQEGDYQGYGSLESALAALSESGGGQAILRGGVHKTNAATLEVPANVSLSGQPGAVVDGSISVKGLGVGAVTMFGSVMESATDFSAYANPGGWVFLSGTGGTGWHRIRKVLRNPATGSRALLDDGIGGVTPVGTIAEIVASNISLENIAILGNLTVDRCRQCVFRNISLISDTAVISSNLTYQSLFDNVDLTQAAASGSALVASNGEYNTYQGIRLSDTRGLIEIADSEQHPTLIACKGDESNSALAIYDLTGTRTTPAKVIGCEGRFAATNLDWIVSNIGSVVRSGEGLGAMRLEDDGTRAAGGDGAISLTGVSGNFNGSSPGALTDSVNERIKAAGDTMSGNLVMGASIVTDGTKRTLGGSSGNDTDKFDIHADDIHIRKDLHLRSNGGGHDIYGLNGLPWQVFNPHGVIESRGPIHHDEFMRPLDAGGGGSFWVSATAGATSPGSVLRLQCDTADNDLQEVRSYNSVDGTVLPGFSTSLKMKTATTDRLDLVGWHENVNVFSVQRDTDISNNWFINFRDGGGTDQSIDTGISFVSLNNWIYLSLLMIGSSMVIFRIGDTQKWAGGVGFLYESASLPGTGTIEQSSNEWDFRHRCINRAPMVTGSEALYGFLTVHCRDRPDGATGNQG